jgi:glutamyl-tRNA synthetase
VSFLDLIRGEVTVDTTDLGDFIIARNINEPVYHLAVVVDDFLAGVTHVIRGEDHISNTPRHILIQEAIGAPRPEYAHLPLILAGDRSKLSKRKHGESVSLDYYRKKGYLPEAILNYLALVGWNPGTEQELFTLDELIKQFDISKVQKGGAVFDEVKLAWINKEHIKRKDSSEVQQSIRHALVTWKPELIDNIHFNTPEYMEKVYPIILDHISVWGDVIQLGEKGSLSFFFETPLYDRSLLFWKDDTDAEKTTTRLSCVYDTLSSAPDQAFSSPEEIKTLIWNYAEQEGRGSVLWPLRVSLSGQQKSPDPFTLVSVLGKKESLKRIQNALDILKQQ